MQCVNCGSGPRCAVLPYECCGNDICGDGMVCAAVCGMGPVCAVPPFQCCGWQICGEGMVCIRDADGARCGLSGIAGAGTTSPAGGGPGPTPGPGGVGPDGPEEVDPHPHSAVDDEHAIPPFIDPSQNIEEVIIGPEGEITIITKEGTVTEIPPDETAEEAPEQPVDKPTKPSQSKEKPTLWREVSRSARPRIWNPIDPKPVSAALSDCNEIKRQQEQHRSYIVTLRESIQSYQEYLDDTHKLLDAQVSKKRKMSVRDFALECRLIGWRTPLDPEEDYCSFALSYVEDEQRTKRVLTEFGDVVAAYETKLDDLSRLARREKCDDEPVAKGDLKLIDDYHGGHPSPYKDDRNPVYGTITYTLADGKSTYGVTGSEQHKPSSWTVTHTWEAPRYLPPAGETVRIAVSAMASNTKSPGYGITIRPGAGLNGNNCSVYVGMTGGGKEILNQSVACEFTVREYAPRANFMVVNGPHSWTYEYGRE